MTGSAKPPRTFLGALTQMANQVQTHIGFAKPKIRPDAKVPQIIVRDPQNNSVKSYDLIDGCYTLGRSSKNTIQLPNTYASSTHISLRRNASKNETILMDEESTNGVYFRKKRIKKRKLKHGDIFTLGPPEIEGIVVIEYRSDSAPVQVKPNPYPSRTFLGSVGQIANKVQTHFGLVKDSELRPGAKVPKIKIFDPENPSSSNELYNLVPGEHTVGRDSDNRLQIKNSRVSGKHLKLKYTAHNDQAILYSDRRSKHGVYWDERRIKGLRLQHGDVITLGSPVLKQVVKLEYINPPVDPPQPKSKTEQVLRYSLYGMAGLVLLGLAWIGSEWQKFSVYSLGKVEGPIVIYARDGTPLQTLQSETHKELPTLKDFSPFLPKAVVASEDSRFYWHFGVDPVRIASAIVINLTGKSLEGASTLTQQVARSLFPDYVGTDDSLGRKVREMVVALKLEAFYSKDQLLLTYLNRVFFGVGYGFEDAAQYYFRKSARDLSLSEAALLTAILPAPNAFNPCEDRETALGLRKRVIERMLKLKMITEEEADQGLRSALIVDPQACKQSNKLLSPYFYSQVVDELKIYLDQEEVQKGNFIVETSLNLKMQNLAEESLREAMRGEGEQYGFSQGAIVTLDAKTGGILALVGGVDYQKSQFNRGTQALRQPGSTFKIFTYTTALTQGISPYSTYSCNPFTWDGQYFGGCERSSGNIDLYRAVAQSENPVALEVAYKVGLENIIKTARKMGIRSKLQIAPGLVLGQSEVTVLEMTGAFGVLANGGTYYRPHAVNRVYNANICPRPDPQNKNCISYDLATDISAKQAVLSPEVAATMTDLLRGVVSSGTGQAAGISGAAGKTGTTNDAVDLWFIGYLPDKGWVTGVWLGNDDNSPTGGSSWLAAELWGNYMQQALQEL
jgi:membrane peptidoglycan carboxypeptidase/pSer/pThr/pTyr-binding forkhead associated (FHA) protein